MLNAIKNDYICVIVMLCMKAYNTQINVSENTADVLKLYFSAALYCGTM